MLAIQIVNRHGPRAVECLETPEPKPGADEVLIRVRAAGVSFPALLQSRGRYQLSPDFPFVPGAEISGEILIAPPGSGYRVGDRVAVFTELGGFADRATAAVERVLPLLATTTFEQGAAFPLNYLTAYFGLIERGRMAAGESALLQGAAGGSAAIQIAKAFGAGIVVAVTSTPAKGGVALRAGADAYVLAEGFKDAVLATTSPRDVDLVFDTAGDDRFIDSLRCPKDDGRLLAIGFAGGEIPSVKVNRLLLTNTSVIGVGLGA